MTAVRFLLVFAAAGVLAGAAAAAPPSGPIPLPRPRPAVKTEKAATVTPRAAPRHDTSAPMSLAPPAPQPATTASLPAPHASGPAIALPTRATTPTARSSPALALATTSNTSPLDLAAVKQAIELARKGRQEEATNIESTISDPLARKLVEWVILRGDDTNLDFPRYAAFVTANPSWPGVVGLRRRAEAALWQQQIEPRSVVAFFAAEPPRSAKGRFALARALLAEGNHVGAQAQVREAWHNEGFSAEVEAQVRGAFADDLLGPADDKARMDARFYAEDDEAAMRAAHHLDGTQMAIARARAAVINKSANAKALLEAVPTAAQRDPGYMFSRIQWLRRANNIPEAARWMIAAPSEADMLGDLDQWWIERRLIARKLLDLNESKLAYEVAQRGAPPVNENYRAEQHFTAGWIALRFLHEPTAALAHFARIADGVTNPITLGRSYYWQGRAAEGLGHGQDARAYYEAAAQYPTAYYGQLSRARLGLDAVALRTLPEPPAEHRRLEVARALEILYAIEERDLVAVMAADLADKVTETDALATLAEIATHHHDARSTLLIGKTALAHGLPLEHYAFPDFGVPSYQPIGPEVEPCVVYSIARQESAFNARVVSSANALGLMQVTPDAGRFVAKKFNVTFNQRRLLDDPVYNAQIGTAELGDEISQFRGSYILAFAAYNAGPHRVKQWLEQYGDPRDPKVDPVDWIERIPFSETRNYVQRVIENMQVYRARMGNDSRLLIEADLRRGG
ncbi:MAG TPA: transglycosylase SLT domain-containing protein [Xanthobacteraceae bacterium]|nr:transglycosylase SLT domain-containing protein [Xanthobacteraceae bacterium]